MRTLSRNAALPNLIILLALSGPLAALEVISTVAGDGANTDNKDGIAATSATIAELDGGGIAVDSTGNVYFSDPIYARVRKIDKATGVITTVAGTGTAGFGGDGGAPTAALLSYPTGLCFDSSDRLYIVDTGNHRIRKVSNGAITTVAGDGFQAGCDFGRYNGDGIAATSASLNEPESVAVDSAGNVFIGDTGNARIRKVDSGTGMISTVAGDGNFGFGGDGGLATAAQLGEINGVALDGSGNIYILDGGRVRKVDYMAFTISTIAGDGTFGYAGDGGPAASAVFNDPRGIFVNGTGDIYIADRNNHRVREIVGANISTIAGDGVARFAGDGGPAAAGSLNAPNGVAVDSAGNVFISDRENSRIRRVDSAIGAITTFAGNGGGAFGGDGGAPTAASLNFSEGVAVDSTGAIYIADSSNHRIRKVAGGTISTIAGTGASGFSGDGGLASGAQLSDPHGLAVDVSGNLFIADEGNQRVRRVDAATGIITTVAGNGTPGFNGDGGAATNAQLDEPKAVALDGAGTLYICEKGNDRIRKVDVNGVISTVVGAGGGGGPIGDGGPAIQAHLCEPNSVAVHPLDSTVYVADTFNYRIRRLAADGTIGTVAGNGVKGSSGDGGAATSASIGEVHGIVFDTAGNLYIADSSNHKIRKVDTNGVIKTWAGTGTFGFSGDGGNALNATMAFPIAVAFGPGGLFVSDIGNNRIRRVRTNNPPVINDVTISQNPMKINTDVTFTADASDADGDPLAFTWSATDGTSGTGNPFVHAFTTAGTFTGTLSVSDGFESTTDNSTTLTVLAPASSGAGVANVSEGKPPVVNPLNSIGISVTSSDGGVVELAVDIEALNRAAFEASTDFTDVPGRSSTGVRGPKPVHQFVETGVFVATSSGVEVATNTVKGKARKTLAISRKETGQEARVSGEPSSRDISTRSLKGKFLFGKTAPDSVSFSGSVLLPPGLDLSKVQEFAVGVGNITDVTTVDPKGKGTLPGIQGHIKKLKVKYPRLKDTTLTAGGETARVDVTFSMAGMSAAGFDTEGVSAEATDFNAKKVAARSIQLAFVLAGVSYEASSKVDFKLSAKKDVGSIVTSRIGR